MIYVECKPDEVLVKALGIPRRGVIHEHCKGNICNRLLKSRDSKGLVDDDPRSGQPSYVRNLKVESQGQNIKLLLDEQRSNHLIVLCPTLEEFVLKASEEAGVDVKAFGLPDTLEELHKVINIRLEKFNELIPEIRNSPLFKTLDSFIKR